MASVPSNLVDYYKTLEKKIIDLDNPFNDIFSINTEIDNRDVKIFESICNLLVLDVETIQVLKAWQLEQRKQLLKLGINSMNKHQLIFSNRENKYIYSDMIRKVIKTIAKKAGIHPITTHGFRHTHATLLFASGLDIKQVQARLGHSKINTTLNIYTHALKEKNDNVGDEFARYINLK